MIVQWRDVTLQKLSAHWTREILYSLRLCVVLVLHSRTRFLCLKDYVGVFEKGNPPCNAEDNLRARLIAIEAYFRGY